MSHLVLDSLNFTFKCLNLILFLVKLLITIGYIFLQLI